MADQNTVKILSLDGGGIRGLFSARFLEQFCNQAELDQSKLFEHFDVIIGTSIGGIQSIAYAEGKTPSYIQNELRTKGRLIFKDNGALPAYKARVIMGLSTDSTFYKNTELKNVIQSVVGTKKMSEIGGNVVITAWNMSDNTPVLFSNIAGFTPYLTGSSLNATDVALATAAAPLYFPKANINGKDYVDGGVIQNNPSLLGLLIAKRLFPTKTRVCLLSVGTTSPWPNKGDVLADEVDSTTPGGDTTTTQVPANVEYLLYLLQDVFMGGVQKLNDRTMKFLAQSIYDQVYYYRFQYQFPKGEAAPMDDASDAFLTKMETLADNKFTTDNNAITNFIKHFNL